MPLQRRLPKMGFSSRKSRFVDELRLNELALVDADVIDLDSLKAANLISRQVLSVKVFASGSIVKAVTLKGIRVTSGARAAIEAAGGTVED
jgi:large subunit ribosomal protein L15